MPFALILSILLFAATSTSASQIRQHCVLLDDGTQKCHNPPALTAAIRIGKSPCLKMDKPCWSLQAMRYTNEIRQKFKVDRMLIPGPFRQLDNAIRYAAVLNRRGRLKHQNLKRVTKEVRCKRWVGGENIAFNYARGDIAKACVLQWLHSKKHRDNLVRPWFRDVVIGIHFGRYGRVYCVQTFAIIHNHGTFGPLRGKRCRRVFDRRRARKRRRHRWKQNRLPKRSRDEGNRSCRCLQVGKRCWFSLKKLSGNRCTPFLPASKQPLKCKWKCCQYCRFYSENSVCKSPRVKNNC